MLAGEIHRNVAALGVAEHDDGFEIRVRVDLLDLVDGEENVLFGALVRREPSKIGEALHRQRRVAGQIMLNGGDQIALGREHVTDEIVLIVPDGVGVIDDRDTRLEAELRLEFGAAADFEQDRDGAIS